MSILLSLIMVFSLFTIVPLSASAAVGDVLSEDDYLTFTAEEAGSTVTLKVNSGSNFQYDLNGAGLTDYSPGTPITLQNAGDYVRFCGKDTKFSWSNHVSLTGKVACSGNVMSLRLDDDGKVQGLAEYCFDSMFSDCTGLTSAPELPETDLNRYCYYYMFENCTNLTKAPELPATNLAESCYENMFYGCTSLTELPALPATTLAESCYNGMFYGCTNICISDEAGTFGDITYSAEYRIPTTGEGTSAYYALNNMFEGTGGEFTGTPSINTTYYVPAPAPETFKVYVKKLTGETYTIENLTGETTVAQLKEIIADQIDIPAAAQRLIFAGKQLEDAKTLAEYNIVEGSTIHLVIRGYTVTWLNYDNSELGTTTVQYGATPSYDGTPERPEDANNTYTFSGWSDGSNTYAADALPAVSGDVTYTAQYTATYPLCVGDTQVTSANASNIMGAETATASYDADTNTLTLNGFSYTDTDYLTYSDKCGIYWTGTDDLNIVLTGENTIYSWSGEGQKNGIKATNAGIVISGEGTLNVTARNYPIITSGNLTINSGSITVKSNRSEAIDASQVLINGGELTATAMYGVKGTVKNAIPGIGWTDLNGTQGETAIPVSTEGQNIKSFRKVTFQAAAPTYTVTWKNWNGDVLETDENVAAGSTPTYDGATPVRPEDMNATYTFSAWDGNGVTYLIGVDDLPPVEGDVTYTAVYTADIKKLFVGHSVTLGGDIGVNFYIDPIVAGVADAQTAVVKFAWDGGKYIQEVNLKELTPNDKGWLMATVNVVAAQMAHTIEAVAYINGNMIYTVDLYSVQDYAEAVYAEPEKYDPEKPEQLKALAAAMLHYGSEAQTVFESALTEKPDRADKNVAAADYSGVTADAVAEKINGTASDLNAIASQLDAEFYTSSLIYLQNNTLRLYFTPASMTIGALNDKGFSGAQSEYYYYADHANIAAAELDDQQEFAVGNVTFNYSPLDYVKAVIESANMTDAQKNLAKSLFLYNQAANAYFG